MEASAPGRDRRHGERLSAPARCQGDRTITGHLLGQAGFQPDGADSGAVTLIQRFGSAADLTRGRSFFASLSSKFR